MQIVSQSWKDFGEIAYCSLILEYNGKSDTREGTPSLGAHSRQKWRSAHSKTRSGLELSSAEEASIKRLSNNYNIRLEDHIHHSSWTERQAKGYSNEEFLRSQSYFYMYKCDFLYKQLNDLQRQQSANFNTELKGQQPSQEPEHDTREFFENYLQKLNAKLLKEASKSCKLETLLMRYDSAIAAKDAQIMYLYEQISNLTKDNANLRDSLTAEYDRSRRKAFTMNAQRFGLENRLITDLEREDLNFRLEKERIDRYEIENSASDIINNHKLSDAEKALLTKQIKHFLLSKAVSVIFGVPLVGTRDFCDVASYIERKYSREAMRRALSYYSFDLATEEMLPLVEQQVFCAIRRRSAQV